MSIDKRFRNMTKPVQFEKSIAELEKIVQQLEQGELPLQDALIQFEKGISLVRLCQETIHQAEQKIEFFSQEISSIDG